MDRKTFALASAGILLLAFLVREAVVLGGHVPTPIRGDAASYVAYMVNLVYDGVFSMQPVGVEPYPDAYRNPGYPWLLSLLFRWLGDGHWYGPMLQLQVLMGVATVGCVIALAREWLPEKWALVAGVWMALQPHHVVATGYLLTEVMLGLAIAGGLLASVVALRERSLPLAVLAGAIWGAGYLVNPVLAFFPILLAGLFWRERLPKHAAALALFALVAVGGWSVRNAAVGARPDDRAIENFVQGSWPLYHAAYASRDVANPMPRKILREIDMEAAHIGDGGTKGWRMVRDRLAHDPWGYARWYALKKPFLLWDWSIRIGEGEIYTFKMERSPMERAPLSWAVAVQKWLNPAVFGLMLVGVVLAFRSGRGREAALFVLYITAVHVVLQAEPRYAIPYRSAQILLATMALAWLWQRVRLRRLAPA